MVKKTIQEAKQVTSNAVEFTKRVKEVVEALLAFTPPAAGVYTVLYGHKHLVGLAVYVVIYTGLIATVLGLFNFYKHLMKEN